MAITFHCPRQRTNDWRNRPAKKKRNLRHPLLPSIGWMFN